jgi:D-sedoheptulose 7-phosphate isomerase
MKSSTHNIFKEFLYRYKSIDYLENSIFEAFQRLKTCVINDGTIFVCGNGGSAADCDHIVGELLKGFRLPRKLDDSRAAKIRGYLDEDKKNIVNKLQAGIKAISLTAHTALLTAISNDIDSDMIYAQQISVLGKEGDVLIGLSTSGNAENVFNGLAIGKALGLKTISLSGRDGGIIRQLSDIAIIVQEKDTYIIQEYHLPIYHCLCAMIENELFGEDEDS